MSAPDSSPGADDLRHEVEVLRRHLAAANDQLAAARAERDRWRSTVYLTLLSLSDIVPADRLKPVEPSPVSIEEIIREIENDFGPGG